MACLSFFTWQRNSAWQDPIVFWEAIVSRYPDSYRGQGNLANALGERGRLAEALVHFQQALRLNQKDARIYLNLGMTLVRLGQPGRALSYLSIAAMNAGENLPEAQLEYAIGLQQAGRPREALVYYREALRLAPDNVRILNGIGEALLLAGRAYLAQRYFRQALRRDPAASEAKRNLAKSRAALRGTGPLK